MCSLSVLFRISKFFNWFPVPVSRMVYGVMAVRICVPTACPCWNSIQFNWITIGVTTRCQLLVYSQCSLFFQWHFTQHISIIRGLLPVFPENKYCTKMLHSLLNSSIITQLLWHWLQNFKLHLVWVYSMWPTLIEARVGMSSCTYDFAHVLIVSLSGTGKIPYFELCKTIFCSIGKKKKFVLLRKYNV